MTQPAYIFECSSSTYLDCVEKNLFGSNKPRPLEFNSGDCAGKYPDIRSGFSLARTGWIRPVTQFAEE